VVIGLLTTPQQGRPTLQPTPALPGNADLRFLPGLGAHFTFLGSATDSIDPLLLGIGIGGRF